MIDEKILRRYEKLLLLSEDDGASKGERVIARQQIERLRAQHGGLDKAFLLWKRAGDPRRRVDRSTTKNTGSNETVKKVLHTIYGHATRIGAERILPRVQAAAEAYTDQLVDDLLGQGAHIVAKKTTGNGKKGMGKGFGKLDQDPEMDFETGDLDELLVDFLEVSKVRFFEDDAEVQWAEFRVRVPVPLLERVAFDADDALAMVEAILDEVADAAEDHNDSIGSDDEEEDDLEEDED